MASAALVSAATGITDGSEAYSMASLASVTASAALTSVATASSAASSANTLGSDAASVGLVDSSAASVTKSLAVYSDPGSDEYPIKEMVMDASLDMVVTYDDSSIA